mgnify:CR=1 FL=1
MSPTTLPLAARLSSRQRTLIILSLSLGGPDPLDLAFLQRTRAFLERHKVALYSEHLSYCSADGHLYDLLPIPFTDEAVRHVAGRIAQVQDVLGRRIAVENLDRPGRWALLMSVNDQEMAVRAARAAAPRPRRHEQVVEDPAARLREARPRGVELHEALCHTLFIASNEQGRITTLQARANSATGKVLAEGRPPPKLMRPPKPARMPISTGSPQLRAFTSAGWLRSRSKPRTE